MQKYLVKLQDSPVQCSYGVVELLRVGGVLEQSTVSPFLLGT